MRVLIIILVFALVLGGLFLRPIQAGEDHGEALREQAGISYGARSQARVITGADVDKVEAPLDMELIQTTIEYVGMTLELPAELMAPEYLYSVEDGYVADGYAGKSLGQIAKGLEKGWFGMNFLAEDNWVMSIKVNSQPEEAQESHRKNSSVELPNVPGGFMNVDTSARVKIELAGRTYENGEGLRVDLYAPGTEIQICFIDLYRTAFKIEHKWDFVELDRKTAVIEGIRNVLLSEPTGVPEKQVFGISPEKLFE